MNPKVESFYFMVTRVFTLSSFEEIESLKNRFIDRLSVIHVFSKENLGNPLQKGELTKINAKIYTRRF